VSKPRITAAVRKNEAGEPSEMYLYLNPEGRALLIAELLKLDEHDDHLHLLPEEGGCDVPLQVKAYDPERELLVRHVKILYRTDAWDEKYFPHVMETPGGTG